MSSEKYVKANLLEAKGALDALLANDEVIASIAKAGELLASTFKAGHRVYSCGNGGSMCDAMHFAEELSGRFRKDRPGLPAASISDPGHLTCVGNDFGFEHIFSRYVESFGQKGDCLLAISTSGKSKNILAAVDAAKKRGLQVIGLTGSKDTSLASKSDVVIATKAGAYADRVQELHIKAIHIMIELVERALFPANYTEA